eukprot:9075604-Pyramimonas_sp.AAC.1
MESLRSGCAGWSVRLKIHVQRRRARPWRRLRLRGPIVVIRPPAVARGSDAGASISWDPCATEVGRQ